MSAENDSNRQLNIGLGLECLMPLLTIFQPYRGSHYEILHRVHLILD
jgi:hypothetical protein